MRAESLAREAFRIRKLINSSDHYNIGNCCGQLARILRQQGHYGDETRGFYERALAIAIGNEGIDGQNVGASSMNIGTFFYESAKVQSATDVKKKLRLLGKSHHENGHRIYVKLFGANHPETKRCASQMANASNPLLTSSLS